jgi:predicted PurR-regulated permease PerM
MNIQPRKLLIIPLILIIAFFIWYFSTIIAYILIAAVLSLIGQPLVKRLSNIKIRKWSFTRGLSALITLLLIIAVFFAIFFLLVPVIYNQAAMFSNIDVNTLSKSFKEPIGYLEDFVHRYNIIAADQTVETTIYTKLMGIFSLTNVSSILNSIIGFTSSFFVAFFAISFITFFFLKDDRLFLNIIMALTPVDYQTEIKHVFIECKRMLSQYFRGLFLDIIIVMTLISLGMWILGLKNAIIIGVIAGMMNVIPYVGVLIGGALAILFGLSGNLDMDFYTGMLPLTGKICLVLICINLLDGLLLQPTIFSNSVKAHPLEIFIVIMISGSIAGITGMILAIPAYTVLRIIAREFFSRYKTIKKLTEKLED